MECANSTIQGYATLMSRSFFFNKNKNKKLFLTFPAKIMLTFHCENNFGNKIPFTAHYHLEVQANPPKMAPKNRCYVSIYGRNGIIP